MFNRGKQCTSICPDLNRKRKVNQQKRARLSTAKAHTKKQEAELDSDLDLLRSGLHLLGEGIIQSGVRDKLEEQQASHTLRMQHAQLQVDIYSAAAKEKLDREINNTTCLKQKVDSLQTKLREAQQAQLSAVSEEKRAQQSAKEATDKVARLVDEGVRHKSAIEDLQKTKRILEADIRKLTNERNGHAYNSRNLEIRLDEAQADRAAEVQSCRQKAKDQRKTITMLCCMFVVCLKLLLSGRAHHRKSEQENLRLQQSETSRQQKTEQGLAAAKGRCTAAEQRAEALQKDLDQTTHHRGKRCQGIRRTGAPEMPSPKGTAAETLWSTEAGAIGLSVRRTDHKDPRNPRWDIPMHAVLRGVIC